MKSRILKGIIMAFSITSLSIGMVGCGSNTSKQQTSSNTKETSGTITALGSTALQPLADEASKNFMAEYPKIMVNVQGGGSGAGLNQVATGTIQIGNSDVTAEDKIKDKNISKQLIDHKVCGIGFAIVTSKDVTATSLTKKQIQDIFTGKITSWKSITGQDEAINVINRPQSSGTRATFKNTVMDNMDEKQGLGTIQDSSGSVEKAISSTNGAISYIALSYLTSEKRTALKVVQIDKIDASKENIVSGKYKFWSFEHMYTKGEAQGATKKFIDYMVSDENKSLVEKLGYIPMRDLKNK